MNSAWLTGLSAVATMNSGYMFIGVVGLTFIYGLQTIWLMAGWICGDYVAWRTVFRRVREQTGKSRLNSVPSLLGHTEQGPDWPVRILTGLVTLFGLGAYAGAQFNAGSKALHVLFGWPLATGAILGAVIVVLYCFAGGLRASIWTDAAQSVVMMLGMLLLVGVSMHHIGSPVTLYDRLGQTDPALIQLIPDDLQLGFVLWLIGWMFAGFAVVGQPHVMIRPMAIRSAEQMQWARRTYFGWYIPFYCVVTLVSLYAREILPEVAELDGQGAFDPETGQFDPELALPTIALALLPQVVVGIILGALFAATMSTADSQIISCSASITQDIVPRWRESYAMSKVSTLAVAGVALAFALLGDESVFELVLAAWSFLAAGLGPLLVVRVLRAQPPSLVACLMVVVGASVAVAWGRTRLGEYDGVYEIMPGMLSGFAVYGLWRLYRLRALW